MAAGKAIAFGLIGHERTKPQKDETPIFDPVVATSQMTGSGRWSIFRIHPQPDI